MGKRSTAGNKQQFRGHFNPWKWILGAGALALTIILAGVFFVATAIQSYLKSDALRDQLTAAAGKKLNADIDLDTLRWDGSTVYAAGLRCRGYPGAAFASMDMDGLRALFDGAKDSAWQIPEIRINQLSLNFSDERLAAPAPSTKPGDESPSTQGTPSWLKRWIPDRAEIGALRIDATNLLVKDKQGHQTFALTSVETLSRPMDTPGAWEITGHGGKLLVRDLPPLSLDRAEIRWDRDEVFINHAALGFHDNAELSGTGDIKLGEDPQLNLDLQLGNLDSNKLLSDDWRKKISGKLEGNLTVNGNPKLKSELTTKGTLRLKDGVVEGLPLLDLIAQYTKMQRFKRLALHQASADFVKVGDRIEISDLVLQSDGLTRLEGSFTLKDRQIADGQFRLGVTPGTLRWIPGAEQKVFTHAENGFLWTPLEISGTLDQPRENLSARLAGAAVESLVEDAPNQATDAAKKMLQNPSGAIDTGKKLLDSLVPLLK